MCPTIIKKIIASVEKDNKSGIFEKDKWVSEPMHAVSHA